MNALRNALSRGHRLHCYEIDSVLGEGDFGITYLAYDSNLDQPVAIREFLPSDLVTRTQDSAVYPRSGDHLDTFGWGLNRFLGEARTLAVFRHPSVVRVLAVFEANNTGYMVMEYERGASLEDALASGRVAVDEDALRALLMPLLEGLEQLHAAGLVHRGIKPGNILLRTSDGGGSPLPVLTGFGSARQAAVGGSSPATALATTGYAPFEQYDTSRDPQGPWTDIYSLAATLYRAVTGSEPPDALSRVDPAMRGEDVLAPSSRLAAGRCSSDFLAAIDSGLALMPGDRPQSIARWRAMFEGKVPATGLRHVGADTVMAKPTTAPPGTARGGIAAARRSRLPLVVVAGLAVTVAAGVWWTRAGDAPSPLTLADDPAMPATTGGQESADGATPTAGTDSVDATSPAAAPSPDESRREAEIARQQAEQEAQRQAEIARQQAEQEAQRQAEIARQQVEQEAQRQAEATRQQAEQEAQRQAEAARMQRVATLLSEADADITALRLTSPPGRNALERLREVQTLDPGNADAARLLGRIEASYLALVDRAIAAGNLDRAQSFASRIEGIAPGSSAALDARNRITAARGAPAIPQ